jgi:two-component system chemotaxis sensor kinase CheA
LKNYNILVVDNDTMITHTLQKVITLMLKQNVIAFNNPMDALAQLEAKALKIDLVISDYSMAQMTGIEFLKKIKEISPDTIRILLSGYADKHNALKSMNEIGIFYYMEKPWDSDALISVIQNAMEKKRLIEELNEKVRELEARNLEIKTLYLELENQYRKESEKSITLETMVAERTASVRNLLDNTGQGFLTFGRDLIVHIDYSRECRRIFGRSITGESFARLLYGSDAEQIRYMTNVVEKIFDADSEEGVELYLPLLPDYFEHLGRKIMIEYRLIRNSIFKTDRKMMAILTDITERMEMEKQRTEEKDALKMALKVISSSQDFSTCVHEFMDFVNEELEEIIQKSDSMTFAINTVYWEIHTFKGNFSLFDMSETVKTLHDAEEKLFKLTDSHPGLDREGLINAVRALDLRSGFDRDLAKIRALLGDKFLWSDKTINIDRGALVEIETYLAKRLNPHDFLAVIPAVRALGCKKAKEIFKVYHDYLASLSERYGKLVKFNILGEDELIDPVRNSGFLRALVHVFRNSVVHGIESPEERLRLGKSEYGHITCAVYRKNSSLHIEISDDGRGLDTHLIQAKAIEKGILSPDSQLTADGINNLIFHDRFSTLNEADSRAGRGIGLPAVRKELECLKGHVDIHTALHRGTTFHFTLPQETYDTTEDIALDKLLEAVVSASSKLFKDILDSPVQSISSFERVQEEPILFQEHTVFIDLEGVFEGTFFASFDQVLTQAFIETYGEGAGSLEDEKAVHDTLAEVTNVILGNSFGQLAGISEFLIVKTPYFIRSVNGSISIPGIKNISCTLSHFCGNLRVGLLKRG